MTQEEGFLSLGGFLELDDLLGGQGVLLDGRSLGQLVLVEALDAGLELQKLLLNLDGILIGKRILLEGVDVLEGLLVEVLHLLQRRAVRQLDLHHFSGRCRLPGLGRLEVIRGEGLDSVDQTLQDLLLLQISGRRQHDLLVNLDMVEVNILGELILDAVIEDGQVLDSRRISLIGHLD
jgi:hypothetical protein